MKLFSEDEIKTEYILPKDELPMVIDCLKFAISQTHSSGAVHEISADHRSLSGTISCMTDRIRFLPVTMTGMFSNFNSLSYTEDRHEYLVISAQSADCLTRCPALTKYLFQAMYYKVKKYLDKSVST